MQKRDPCIQPQSQWSAIQAPSVERAPRSSWEYAPTFCTMQCGQKTNGFSVVLSNLSTCISLHCTHVLVSICSTSNMIPKN